MKLVATVMDGNAYYHLGLGIEAHSAIIDIPDEQLPELVKDYQRKLEDDRQYKRPNLTTLRFSVLQE